MEHESIINDLISDVSKRYWKQRELQIKERLIKSGYSFASDEEFHAFAKEHLTLATYQNRPFYQEILLDGKLLAWWETEPVFNFDQNAHTYKITIG